MPPEKRKRIEAQNDPDDKVHTQDYPPEKYKLYLGCPFPKHAPDLYVNVNNVCTERWGFRDIGDLNYHIQRVHSPEFGCIKCKSRFTQSKNGQSKKVTAEQAKRDHDCKPRDFTNEDPQWMTEEQESRLANWKEPGKAQEGGAKSWAKIYMCLFGTAKEDVPYPFYDYMVPKHLLDSSMNDSPNLAHHVENINSSLTQPVAREIQSMENLGALDDQQNSQLNRNTLEKHKVQDDHGFDWSVKRALDSGYGSGNAQEPPEQDLFFSQDPIIPLVQPTLRSEDKGTLISWTMGASDVEEIDYDEFLNLEDKSKDDLSF